MSPSRRTIVAAATLSATASALAGPAKASEVMDLQAEIAKANQQGGVLRLPPGEIVTAPVEISQGVTITGVAGRTRLRSAGGSVFIVRGDAPVVLAGLSFSGPGGDEGLVRAEAASDLTVEGCAFNDTSGNALVLERAGGRIAGNRFTGIGRTAIFSRDATGLLITGNTITDTGNNAIQVWTSAPAEDGTIVADNRIARVAHTDGGSGQNGNGIMIFRAGNVIVTGNRISDCAFTAVRNNAGGNCHIVNNNISRTGEVAIYCEFGFDGAVVSGNIIADTGLGISVTNLDYNGRLASIANNVVRRCRGGGPLNVTSGTGIHAEGDATITGNVVEDVRDAGLSLGWGPHSRTLMATGNMVRNARIGIAFSTTSGADAVMIASNRVSGAREAGIQGHDHLAPTTGDLSLPGAAIPAGAIIKDNLTG